MATREFPLVPETVPAVETKYRRIKTQIPHPDSIATLTKLRNMEPRSMGGQPPILWHHGKGFTVSDAYGNQWLDFSAGVLVTASGHGRPEIVKAISADSEYARTLRQSSPFAGALTEHERRRVLDAVAKASK